MTTTEEIMMAILAIVEKRVNNIKRDMNPYSNIQDHLRTLHIETGYISNAYEYLTRNPIADDAALKAFASKFLMSPIITEAINGLKRK